MYPSHHEPMGKWAQLQNGAPHTQGVGVDGQFSLPRDVEGRGNTSFYHQPSNLGTQATSPFCSSAQAGERTSVNRDTYLLALRETSR